MGNITSELKDYRTILEEHISIFVCKRLRCDTFFLWCLLFHDNIFIIHYRLIVNCTHCT